VKQPRRWVVVLAALLMAASLVLAPREGSAGSAGPELMLGDPRPTVELGGPETPPDPGSLVFRRVWLWSVLIARGLQVDLTIVVEAPGPTSSTQVARCAPRTAVRT
jgi:hypothetical protein